MTVDTAFQNDESAKMMRFAVMESVREALTQLSSIDSDEVVDTMLIGVLGAQVEDGYIPYTAAFHAVNGSVLDYARDFLNYRKTDPDASPEHVFTSGADTDDLELMAVACLLGVTSNNAGIMTESGMVDGCIAAVVFRDFSHALFINQKQPDGKYDAGLAVASAPVSVIEYTPVKPVDPAEWDDIIARIDTDNSLKGPGTDTISELNRVMTVLTTGPEFIEMIPE